MPIYFFDRTEIREIRSIDVEKSCLREGVFEKNISANTTDYECKIVFKVDTSLYYRAEIIFSRNDGGYKVKRVTEGFSVLAIVDRLCRFAGQYEVEMSSHV